MAGPAKECRVGQAAPERNSMADDCCASKGRELERLARQGDQRRVLLIVLAVNAVMFVAEFAGGLVAGSAALMADSVDMLGMRWSTASACMRSPAANAGKRAPRWRKASSSSPSVSPLWPTLR